jgi:hypothetical protein
MRRFARRNMNDMIETSNYLSFGARQMAVSKREQWAALHAAADSGREDLVQVSISRAFCWFVAHARARAQILLDAGHSPGSLDMHKATPLHRAAASGSLKTVSICLLQAPSVFPPISQHRGRSLCF